MILPAIGLAVGAWEALWWAERRARRGRVYKRALARSRETGKPLLVVGAPDHGPTAGYGCGDMVTDIEPGSRCPNLFQSDLTRGLPLPDDSVVTFVPCVLEYVSDPRAAVAELLRVSDGDLYVVGVEPWTLTGWLYPGTRTVDASARLAGQR